MTNLIDNTDIQKNRNKMLDEIAELPNIWTVEFKKADGSLRSMTVDRAAGIKAMEEKNKGNERPYKVVDAEGGEIPRYLNVYEVKGPGEYQWRKVDLDTIVKLS